jgi:hypothetical protein
VCFCNDVITMEFSGQGIWRNTTILREQLVHSTRDHSMKNKELFSYISTFLSELDLLVLPLNLNTKELLSITKILNFVEL